MRWLVITLFLLPAIADADRLHPEKHYQAMWLQRFVLITTILLIYMPAMTAYSSEPVLLYGDTSKLLRDSGVYQLLGGDELWQSDCIVYEKQRKKISDGLAVQQDAATKAKNLLDSTDNELRESILKYKTETLEVYKDVIINLTGVGLLNRLTNLTKAAKKANIIIPDELTSNIYELISDIDILANTRNDFMELYLILLDRSIENSKSVIDGLLQLSKDADTTGIARDIGIIISDLGTPVAASIFELALLRFTIDLPMMIELNIYGRDLPIFKNNYHRILFETLKLSYERDKLDDVYRKDCSTPNPPHNLKVVP